MFPTLKAIAKVVSKADVSACGLKPDQAHVVIIPDPKPGMYGLFLANDILMVDYGSAMSFRTKYCNLGFHKRVKSPCQSGQKKVWKSLGKLLTSSRWYSKREAS